MMSQQTFARLCLVAWLIAAGAWAAAAGWAVSHTHTALGISIFAILAAGFAARPSNSTRHNELPDLLSALITGATSAGVIGWLYFIEPGILPLPAMLVGWIVTGSYNVRFHNWFWGEPMVFENREMGSFLAFVSGPFYWVLALIFLAVAGIGQGIISLLPGKKR